jgi:hypothetical protein
MTSSDRGAEDPGSAKIYAFPARGRFAASDYCDEANLAAHITSPQVVNAAVGGSWYHEAAIQDAERARKN